MALPAIFALLGKIIGGAGAAGASSTVIGAGAGAGAATAGVAGAASGATSGVAASSSNIMGKVLDMAEKSIDSVENKALTGGKKKEEPDWDSYKNDAEDYLSRDMFKNSPLTAEHLATGAKTAFTQTGIAVPVELALAQGQFESMMGTKGRSPVNNPFNIGEFDEGTKMSFNNTQEGVNAYFRTMANDYLKGSNLDNLMSEFVNMDGNRYASDPDYEDKLSGQIEFIRKRLGR